MDFAAQTERYCGIWANHIDGADTSAPFVQSATQTEAANTSITVTLSAFADAGNRPMIFAWKRAPAESFVFEGGYTTLGTEQDQEGDNSEWCAYNSSTADTTPSASWTSSTTAAALASEIKILGGGGGATILDPFGMSGFFGA